MNYCGKVIPQPDTCPYCESDYLSVRGDGVQKLEDWSAEDFPNARVIRMDQDTTSYRGAHEKILSAFRDHEADILVGTQMIAKGHDFPKVSVVGILGADSVLWQSDYRARERAFQLLAQISGRAGRGDVPGHVFIQTLSPDSEIYSFAATQQLDEEKHHPYRVKFYQPEIDTVSAVTFLYPDMPKHNLKDACEFLGIVNESEHRAMGDCRASAAILLRCIKDFGFTSCKQMNAHVGMLPKEEVTKRKTPSYHIIFLVKDHAGKVGGTLPAAMNAANEVVVADYLAGKAAFLDIEKTVYRVMERHERDGVTQNPSLSEIFAVDEWARLITQELRK